MKRSLALCGVTVLMGLAFASPAFADVTPTPEPSAPVAELAVTQNCSAYFYFGSTQTICDKFANVITKVNCEDVGYKVKLVDVNNDPWGLDGNRGIKGVGCESYPVRGGTTPKPTPTKTTTTKPTPTKTSTPKPSRSTTTAPAGVGNHNNTNGTLPVTGDKVKTLGVIGGVLLVGGVIATVVTRRRKGRFVA